MDRSFLVLKTLGGCGGTIVTRSLAAASGALVLSEVSPRSAQLFTGALNPLVQMNRDHFELIPEAWHKVDPHTLGAPLVFGRFMADLSDSLDRPLVIRDYSYVDYIGVPFVWPRPTEPSLEPALEPFGRLRTVLLIRHPARTLRSLLTHPPLATVLSAEEFVAGHLAFLEAHRDRPLVRYEDFLAEPERIVAELCASFGIACKTGWRDDLHRTPAMTGHPDAVGADRIQGPKEHGDSALEAALTTAEGYEQLLRLGGYS